MEKLINKLPKDVIQRLKLIGEVSSELGYPAYVVGGFVRDLILGVGNFDLDIVVEGNGISLAKELSAKMNAKMISHHRFGTATLETKDKIKIDIATARREVYEHSGSLPKVTPGTIQDDLARRDFSINALAFSIKKENFGQLIDFFKGREDLKARRVRALHKLSFLDDPTRILRAVRFAERYKFRIEPATLRWIKKAAGTGILNKVNKQRLRDELILLLKEQSIARCLRQLNKICGFSFIHPALRINKGKLSLIKKLDSIIEWFNDNYPYKRKIDLWLIYLMVALDGLNKSQLNIVLKEFAFRRGEAKRIVSYSHKKDKIITSLKEAVRPSHIYRILDHLSYEEILLVALIADDRRIKDKVESFLTHYNEMRLLLGGHDLKNLGVKPGPHFKEILKSALHAKIDNKLKTKEEELHYLKKKIGRS